MAEWRLLCLPRMSVLLNLLASMRARYLQPWAGFGSSFSHSRLDTSRLMANAALADQREPSLAVLGGTKSSRAPFRPQLHRVLEAQVARVYAGIGCGLRHGEPATTQNAFPVRSRSKGSLLTAIQEIRTRRRMVSRCPQGRRGGMSLELDDHQASQLRRGEVVTGSCRRIPYSIGSQPWIVAANKLTR